MIAANVDRLAIITSVASPPFRAGAVDRFLLAARARAASTRCWS